MKLRIWLLTRDRLTWVTGAEILALASVLLYGGDTVRWIFGLPLLVHVGYRALTSVPLGQIPGRPEWAKQVRRNQDLRSRVVGFLNEMRRVEDIAHRGRLGGESRAAVEKDLALAKRRMMAAATEVVRAAGRVGREDLTPTRDESLEGAPLGVTPRRA